MMTTIFGLSEGMLKGMYSEFVKSSLYTNDVVKNKHFRLTMLSGLLNFDIKSDGSIDFNRKLPYYAVKVERYIVGANRTESVHYRFKPTQRGKGQALDCLFYIVERLDSVQ